MGKKLFTWVNVVLVGLVLAYPVINAHAQTWNADLVIGHNDFTSRGFNNLDNNELYYPYSNSVIVAGKLIVADSSNNRVLIYNTIPTTNSTPADVVIGQTDFNTNTSGCSATKLNNPVGVYSNGTKLFIADYNNNRVLIYNSIPTANGAAANVVVGQANFTTGTSGTSQTKLYNPSGVHANGTKLFIADYNNHRVLIYNSIPTSNGAAASVVVGQTDFVTRTYGTSQTQFYYPFSIYANGTKLFIADRNNSRVLIYNTIPTTNGAPASVVVGQPNFVTGTYGTTQSKMYYPTGVYSNGTKLFVADNYNHRALIYNSIPTSNGALANVVVGQTSFTVRTSGTSSTKLYYPAGICVNGSKLFIADRYNHRTLIYNTIPTSNGVAANVVVGHSTFTNGTANDVDGTGIWYAGRNCIAAGKLFVVDPSNNRVLIYNSIPTLNGATADLVIGQTSLTTNSAGTSQTTLRTPSAVYCDGTKVYIADTGNNRVLIYNSIPTSNGAAASVVVGQSTFTSSTAATSQTGLGTPRDIYVNGKLYIADSSNHRVIIHNTIPTTNGRAADVVVGQPDFITGTSGLSQTKMNTPYGVHANGTKLLVSDTNSHRVLIYNTIPPTNGAAADVVVGQTDFVTGTSGTSATKLYTPNRIFVPQGTSKLYIADSNNHRIIIYNSIPTTNGAAANDVIGQTSFTTRTADCSASKFNYPNHVFTNAKRLYISDYNNNRLLAGTAPNNPPVLDPIGNKTGNEGQLLQFTISATDPDGDSLTYFASNLPERATFDPANRTFSWTPGSGQAGTYSNVHFEVSDGTATDSEDITITVGMERYGFETGTQGWVNSTYQYGQAITTVAQSSARAFAGTYSLNMTTHLVGGSPTNANGEAFIDMSYSPPSGVNIPINLQGKTVTAYVYCPTGSRGNPSFPNGVQIFVKDQNWNSLYSTWVNIVENTWLQLSLPVNNSGSFDSTKVILVGFKIGAGIGSTATYDGPIYLDVVAFPAATLPPADYTYNFNDAGALSGIPRWDVDTGWGAQAWSTVYLSNYALTADATFSTTSDPQRKGYVNIFFTPPIYLLNKDDHIIRAEIRFDPQPGQFDFVGTIWVYDKGGERWYCSDYKSIGGAGGWNVLTFDLDDNTAYDPDLPVGQTMPLDQIVRVGIQIYANTNYTGKVYFDNITIGGKEITANYPQNNVGIVGRSSTNFILNSQQFYFAGANAEYLFEKSVPIEQTVLDSAKNMNLTVVRTWAFGEGEDASFQPQRGKFNQSAFEHLDRLIAYAGTKGLRLVLPLVDNWGHYGGMYQYMDWAYQEHPESVPQYDDKGNLIDPVGKNDAYHDQFFVNQYCKQWYKEYVTYLLNRTNSITGIKYKDDPNIFSWEVFNEPRCKSDVSGKRIHDWLVEMSAFVKGIDSNHLIGSGEEGTYIMKKADADAFTSWQDYPHNYWEYGNNWTVSDGQGGYINWGSNGVDFLSDHKSTNTTVYWQEYIGEKGESTILSEVRAGAPNIDYCSFRTYIDYREFDLYRTDPYDQSIKWLEQHTNDALNVIGKPVVMEEFGIHVVGYIYWGGFGEIKFHRYPAYTVQDRVNIFTKYYNYIYHNNVGGSFFWNLGYDGMREDLFDGCESLQHSEYSTWVIDANSDATAISVSTNYVTQGTNSFKCDYTYNPAIGKAFYNLPNLSEKWEVTAANPPSSGAINRAKFMFDVYNAGNVQYVDVVVCTTANLTWHESQMQALSPGWNTIMVDLASETWKSAASGWNYTGEIADLDDVRKIAIGLFGYSGTGSVYVDNISIFEDDGFVIYSNDPVTSVISDHSSKMAAKHGPVPNNKPTLDWTGEVGYGTDGLDPETGYETTTFTYRIKYTDADNEAPVMHRVYIDKNGDGDYADEGEINEMTGTGTTYSTGVIFTYSTTIPYSSGSTNCKYYFRFSDGADYATGNITQGISPETAIDAPDVQIAESGASSEGRMWRYNLARTSLYPNGPSTFPLQSKWTADGFSGNSPVIANGVVYIPFGGLRAYDAETGSLKWNWTPPESGSYVWEPAIADNGLLYLATRWYSGGPRSKIYCLDANTGAFKWGYDLGAVDQCRSTFPAVYGGKVYIGCDDGKLYVLDATTGAFKWSYDTGVRIETSPAIANNIVYIASVNKLYALDATTGAFKWSSTVGNWNQSSPAVTYGMVYLGSNTGYVYAFDANTGALKWSYNTGKWVNGYQSSPAVTNNTVYIGSGDDINKVFALDATTGAFKWSYTATNSTRRSSPCVSNGIVYITSLDNKLYALDGSTGSLKWDYNFGGSYVYTESSPAVYNKKVYATGLTTGDSYKLHCFRE